MLEWRWKIYDNCCHAREWLNPVCTMGNKDQNKSHVSEILPKVGYMSANEEEREVQRRKKNKSRCQKCWGMTNRHIQILWRMGCRWDEKHRKLGANSLTCLPKKYLIQAMRSIYTILVGCEETNSHVIPLLQQWPVKSKAWGGGVLRSL